MVFPFIMKSMHEIIVVDTSPIIPGPIYIYGKFE